MLIKMENPSGGGGGEYVSGDFTSSGVTSDTAVIHTGLSSITEFYMIGGFPSDKYRQVSTLRYDANDATYKQITSEVYQAGSYNVAAYADMASAALNYNFVIKSISGGDITIQNPSNNSTWALGVFKWFAK